MAVTDLRAIQKFCYVDSDGSIPGYRILLGTYANVEAASEDDSEKGQQIEAACQEGGGFVGQNYYQFELVSNALETFMLNKPMDIGMRTPPGFERFLSHTGLPMGFPFSNWTEQSTLHAENEEGGGRQCRMGQQCRYIRN